MPGCRPNVCIVVLNEKRQVLLGERPNGGWQFPQGGIDEGESAENALYREMLEEIGLQRRDVNLIGHSKEWFEYEIPRKFQKFNHDSGQLVTCQTQRWYLLNLITKDSAIDLNVSSKPEFKQWRWVSFWYPLHCIIDFKRDVYRKGLRALAIVANENSF